MSVKLSKIHKRLNQEPHERLPLGSDNNKIWDDLKEVHDSILGGIHAMGVRIYGAIRILETKPELKQYIPDQTVFANLVQRTSDDIQSHKNKIELVYSQHSSKSGFALNEDDYALALQLHGRYIEITELATSNIEANALEINEIIQHVIKIDSEQPKVTQNPDGTNTIEG